MTTLQKKPNETTTVATESKGLEFQAPFRWFVVGAVCRRDLIRYFTNVAGYVFMVLFILSTAVAAFWPQAFFANNMANLDQLNALMPFLLLLFIPAITMSIWAEERRQGTEELLLTLPARDLEVVLGKYLAGLGIYTAALGFLALGLSAVLMWLGDPDKGILFASYFGYWLMGAMLLALGMVASLLSSNVTVAFILGALFCAVPVFAELLGQSFGGSFGRGLESLSVPAQFRDFGRGVISLSGVLYFVSLAIGMMYINMVLLGRRHWAGGEKSTGHWGHALVRVVSVVIALISLDVLVARAGWRADVSAEKLNTLSSQTRQLIREIPSDKPVYIQAFFSPEVPRDYVETKANLISLLKEYDAIGGNKIQLNLVETERFSEEAREAERQFGIEPRRVFTASEARQGFEEIYLGVAFTSGLEEVVIPFFDRGLPVEYELTRSIRVVSGTQRKQVGILATDANLLGGFDFRMMGQNPEWQIVTELRKQYEVSSVPADSEIPSNIDVLLVAQPSSLTQPQIDNLTEYVRQGGRTLLFLDPLPQFDRSMQMSLAPSQPKESPGGMFGGGPPPEQKGDLRPLLDLLGIDWPNDQIVWSATNPHPKLVSLPREYVFITASDATRDSFNARERITSGLQEVVLLFPGYVRPSGLHGPEFTPLLRSGGDGGVVRFSDLTVPSFMGMGIDPRRAPHFMSGDSYTLAARLEGDSVTNGDDDSEDAPRSIHAIVVADLDMISDGFFALRQAGSEEFEFDNVTFVLNCVDVLAGDESFLELRKQRRKHRTLERMEARDREFEAERLAQEQQAEEEAEEQLEAARERMRTRVQEIEANPEIDDRTKQIMLANVRENEQRRLEVAETNINDAKQQKIEESLAAKEQKLRQIQSRVRLYAVMLPPLPALILGVIVFAVRARRENLGANPNRLV